MAVPFLRTSNPHSSDQEECNGLLGKDEFAPRQRVSRKCYNSTPLVLLVSWGISIFCNVILFLYQLKPLDFDGICSVHTSQYGSPMLKDISVSYDTVQFNGSFSHESIYRQVASPEVDEAWLALGAEYAAIIIPENEAEHYGIQRGQVKRPEEKGGGFFANVEVLHHLHCLNLLRQTSHFDYDYYQKQGKGAFSNSQDVVRKHAGHCLDILRQHIMCTADIGVFGQWWVKGIGPFVDFNTKHKCKNFEEIRKWAEKRQIPDQEGYAKQRADDVVLDEIP